MHSTTQSTHQDSAKQPPAPVQAVDSLSQQAPLAAGVVQCARQRPHLLTPGNVLQLQRVLGNQAVVQLLGRSTPPMVQRNGAGSDPKDKVWKGLTAEQRKILGRVIQGQNLGEVAVQLRVEPQVVTARWEEIAAACREGWALKPEDTVTEAWAQEHFRGLQGVPSIELREMQPGQATDKSLGGKSQDTELTTASGHTLTWDNFDYTLMIKNPDGTGVQLTYVFPKGQPTGKLTKAVPLSKRRVRALEEMSKNQGTYQETVKQQQAREKITPKPTLCNAWPVMIGEAVGTLEAEETIDNEEELKAARESTHLDDLAIGDKLNDRSTIKKEVTTYKDGEPVKKAVGKTPDFNWLNPEGKARKYGAWRTWADTPDGPKPGDLYSFWEAKVRKGGDPSVEADVTRSTGSNKHIGVFKSRRPNPDGKTETWTVTDGGQGIRQEIRERYRTFHPTTQLFTTGAADGGQEADPRWMSGWVDLDAYYTNPQTKKTTADYQKWEKDTNSGKGGAKGATMPQGQATIPAEQWPSELPRTDVLVPTAQSPAQEPK